MNSQFCRVGKIKPNLKKIVSLKELERKISNFVDDIEKLESTNELNTSIN